MKLDQETRGTEKRRRRKEVRIFVQAPTKTVPSEVKLSDQVKDIKIILQNRMR